MRLYLIENEGFWGGRVSRHICRRSQTGTMEKLVSCGCFERKEMLRETYQSVTLCDGVHVVT